MLCVQGVGMANQVLESKQLYLLALGLIVALVPLLSELPIWILPFAVGIYIWRLKAIKRQAGPLSKWIKILAVVSSLLLLLLSVSRLFSLQGFVSLLVLTAALKLLELVTKRDYLLLVFLGCLIAACQLLFSNTLLSFSYALFSLLLLHVTLVASFSNVLVNTQSLSVRSFFDVHKTAFLKMSIIFIQALPIAIALFIVMPRIGSLWAVPVNSGVAKTGVSDTLRAGDIAKFNQDYSVAMRVTFDSQTVPTMSQMYWRGLSLSHFDGSTWSRDKNLSLQTPKLRKQLQNAVSVKSFNYQIMLEASGRSWLYGLNTALANNVSLKQWQDYTITRQQSLEQRFQYGLTSPVYYVDQSVLNAQRFQYYTALPSTQNPKARAFARQIRNQSASTQDFVAKLSSHFRQAFSYTLVPGKSATEDAIDDFLFNGKLGYCEHFASAGAFLLRAAGVPARIVTGYQGGKWSADNEYLLVTQSQAHAWLEYWDTQSGWIRWDPTIYVSPQRITQGVNDFSQQLSNTNLFRQLNNSSWLNQWRLSLDSFNYQWHRWVIDYSAQRQFSLVKALLGEVSTVRIGMFMLLVFCLAMLPFVISFYRGKNKTISDPLLQALQLLDNKLKKHDLHRAHRETLSEFLARAAVKHPKYARAYGEIATVVEAQIYAKASVTIPEVHQLKVLIKQLK